MSTTRFDQRGAGPPAASPAGDRVSLRRVVSSEWIKLHTLRSSWYVLLAGALSMILVGLIVGYATSHSTWATLDPEDTAASGPLQGFKLAQLFIGVLGALFVSGEYGTGMIRSTFAAVPRRLPVLVAKSTVYGVLVLVAMTAASFAAFFAAQLFLSGDGHGSSLGDPGALRSIIGAGLYLTLVGLLGGALGWIVRSTAGAISALVGILLVVPVVLGFLPGAASATLGEYLPSNAGGSITSSFQAPETLAPWVGLAVLALWVGAALVVAVGVMRSRDT